MPDDNADVRLFTDGEPLLTVTEAAPLLGVSERTVRRRIRAGTLAAIDYAGQMRIPASTLGVRLPDTATALPAEARRMTPIASSATETALIALVERQAREIADLTGQLAVAEERLRTLGSDVPSQEPRRLAETAPEALKTVDPRSGPGAWLRRVLGRF